MNNDTPEELHPDSADQEISRLIDEVISTSQTDEKIPSKNAATERSPRSTHS